MAKKIKVEMYFGYTLGDTKMWDTSYVEVPASTPKGKVEQAARKTFIKEWEKEQKEEELSFCGLYAIDNDTEEEMDEHPVK